MNNDNITNRRTQLTIRIGKRSLSCAVAIDATGNEVEYEPYTVRSGISMAANLREAFKESELLMRGYNRAQVLLDTPVLLIPLEEFSEDSYAELYAHTLPRCKGDVVLTSVLPQMNAVAVFSINKDLKLVLDDHFQDVKFLPLAQPVWNYLYQRSFGNDRHKLYAYFHDQRLEVFSFGKKNFRFCNSYEASQSHDALFYLLYVWKQLAYDGQHDYLHLCGDIPDKEWSLTALKRYVKGTFPINPSAEFNRAPITQIKGIPFDLIILFVYGK